MYLAVPISVSVEKYVSINLAKSSANTPRLVLLFALAVWLFGSEWFVFLLYIMEHLENTIFDFFPSAFLHHRDVSTLIFGR